MVKEIGTRNGGGTVPYGYWRLEVGGWRLEVGGARHGTVGVPFPTVYPVNFAVTCRERRPRRSGGPYRITVKYPSVYLLDQFRQFLKLWSPGLL